MVDGLCYWSRANVALVIVDEVGYINPIEMEGEIMKEQVQAAITAGEERIALLRLLIYSRERLFNEYTQRAAEAYNGLVRARRELDELGRMLFTLRKHSE